MSASFFSTMDLPETSIVPAEPCQPGRDYVFPKKLFGKSVVREYCAPEVLHTGKQPHAYGPGRAILMESESSGPRSCKVRQCTLT